MRTTLILRDDLVESAKKQAAERKTTLSAIVDEALMRALEPASPELVAVPPLPTYAPSGTSEVDTPPEIFTGLMVAEDLERYGQKEAP